MLGSDTTMGLSWRWNTVGCPVEPLDGYGWFLGSLTCYAPFSAGSDSLLPWKERKEIWAVEHILCPRAMPSAPPCRARLELVHFMLWHVKRYLLCHGMLSGTFCARAARENFGTFYVAACKTVHFMSWYINRYLLCSTSFLRA